MKMEDERANKNTVPSLQHPILSEGKPLAVDYRAIAAAQVADRHCMFRHPQETVLAADGLLVVNADPHLALWAAAELVFSRAENQPGVLPSGPNHVEYNSHGSAVPSLAGRPTPLGSGGARVSYVYRK
jgi:hypothetical protein